MHTSLIFYHLGLKLELNGPIVVRRGVLLLTPKNVRILGGRVSDREDKCSLVQQLTDVLGRENVSSLLKQHTNRPAQINQQAVIPSAGNSGDVFNDDEDDLFNAIEDPPPLRPSLPTTSSYSRPSGYLTTDSIMGIQILVLIQIQSSCFA